MSGVRPAFILIVLVVLVVETLAQRPEKPLWISEPVNGTIVSPGQVVTVKIEASTDRPFGTLSLVSEMGTFSLVGQSFPAEVELRVPSRAIAARKYLVSLVETRTSGSKFEALDYIELDVEPAQAPARIEFGIPWVDVEALGDAIPIELWAAFVDGRTMDVTESSRITYLSSDTTVAIVREDGAITPMGLGHAMITARYRFDGHVVETTIPVNVPSLAVTPSDKAISFGEQAVGTMSKARPLTLTNTSSHELRLEIDHLGAEFEISDHCTGNSPLAEGASCVLFVSFRPSELGPRTGTISIENSRRTGRAVIPLTGEGVR